MNTKNTMRIAIAEIMCQKMRFFLSILLIGISLGAIGYFFMFTNVSKYNKEECDRLLSRGLEGTGAMQVFGEPVEILIKEAMNSGLFECIGTWETAISGNLLPMELMERRIANGGNPAEATKWLYIDRTAVGIHVFRFAEKMEIPEEKWNDSKWHGIYLGGNYSGISLGTVFEIEKITGYDTFEVIGILEEGQMLVSESVMQEGRAGWIGALENLDDVIIVPQYGNAPAWYRRSSIGGYTPAKGVSMEDARSYLEKKARELGFRIEVGYLKDGFFAEEIEERDIQRVNKELNIVLFVTCLLICACILLMQMIGEKTRIGVFFAHGLGYGDIIRIYVWQGILKVLIAFGLAYLCIKKYFENVLAEVIYYGGISSTAIKESEKHAIFKLLNRWITHAGLPRMIGAAIIVIAVCILIPVLLIRKKVPAELLKETRG